MWPATTNTTEAPVWKCGRVRRITKKATNDDPEMCHACGGNRSRCPADANGKGMCNGVRKGKLLAQIGDALCFLGSDHA